MPPQRAICVGGIIGHPCRSEVCLICTLAQVCSCCRVARHYTVVTVTITFIYACQVLGGSAARCCFHHSVVSFGLGCRETGGQLTRGRLYSLFGVHTGVNGCKAEWVAPCRVRWETRVTPVWRCSHS